MRADEIAMRHQDRPRWFGQNKVEYANAFERHRRPVAKATKAAVALAVLLALGALFMWRVQL